jgi:hypothetical protein
MNKLKKKKKKNYNFEKPNKLIENPKKFKKKRKN